MEMFSANPEISPASLWNRKDIQEFKNNIKKEGTEGIIKVGHGETVTVRHPGDSNKRLFRFGFPRMKTAPVCSGSSQQTTTILVSGYTSNGPLLTTTRYISGTVKKTHSF